MASYLNIVQGGASITVGSDLGYIRDGVTLVVNAEPYYTSVEGINCHIHARMPQQNYEVRTTLMEPTLANLKIAFDWQTASATAASAAINEFGGDNFKPTERDVKIYGYVPGASAYTRYFQLFRAIAVGGGEVKSAHDEETRLPVVFHGLYYPTSASVGLVSDATS